MVQGAHFIILEDVALGLQDVGLGDFDGFRVLGVLRWWLWWLRNFNIFFHVVLSDTEERLVCYAHYWSGEHSPVTARPLQALRSFRADLCEFLKSHKIVETTVAFDVARDTDTKVRGEYLNDRHF